MIMQNSVELGWIVTMPESDWYYDSYIPQLGGATDSRLFREMPEDDNGHNVPLTDDHPDGTCPGPLYVETHTSDISRVFVSWVTLEHGWTDFTEPPALAQLVRSHIAKYDQEAVVTWGVIETRR